MQFHGNTMAFGITFIATYDAYWKLILYMGYKLEYSMHTSARTLKSSPMLYDPLPSFRNPVPQSARIRLPRTQPARCGRNMSSFGGAFFAVLQTHLESTASSTYSSYSRSRCLSRYLEDHDDNERRRGIKIKIQLASCTFVTLWMYTKTILYA